MSEVLRQALDWVAGGRQVAIATLIATERSAPLDPGAALVVTDDGQVSGSVSGGCVEGAVIEEAGEVLRTGAPRRLRYGIADEDAFAVGLTCGGTVHLFVDRADAGLLRRLVGGIEVAAPMALATRISPPSAGARLLLTAEGVEGSLGDAGLDQAVAGEARAMLAQGITGTRHFGPSGEARQQEVEVFIQAFAPPPAMYVFGAIDFARAVARVGKFLGYRVTVCDARAPFVTRRRFPEADELVVEWPDAFIARAAVDERTAICVLTHDPKFDVPLLKAALATNAAYIGAMGSRRTDDDRTRRLLQEGVSETALARIRGPIGLDVGARTPEEVAVAVAAEIIALRTGRPGGFLRDRPGPVHG